ncbi:MAG: hypothetical protein ACI33N_05335 [Desulfovibrionaceae bacterium]
MGIWTGISRKGAGLCAFHAGSTVLHESACDTGKSVLQSHQPQPCMRKEVAVHLLSRTKAAG